MSKMWAQVLISPGQLEYKKIDIPEYNSREILVKMKSACICNGSDPNMYDGCYGYSDGMVFGHEPFGEVVEYGNDVNGFSLGDKISWWFSSGAFAEYAVVDPQSVAVIKVPDLISRYEGPLLELVAAASRAIKVANIQKGSNVLIIGLGPSGLLMSQEAKALGASKVIGWDLYDMRREKGLSLGCDQVYNPRDTNLVDKTSKGAGEVDVIIDAFGDDVSSDESTMNRGLRLLKNGGKVVLYGHPRKGRRLDLYLLQSLEATIYSPVSAIQTVRDIMVQSLQKIIDGTIVLEPLISDVIGLEQVGLGLSMVRKHPNKYLKIIVDIENNK